MTQSTLYPMLITPVLHVKVWGGRRLETTLGKTLFGDAPYGESWELHDTCTIANGEYAGETVRSVVNKLGHTLIGEHNDPADGLPLLVKFLDANAWLSVQVHPDDEQARELEGDPRGKTEAWYIIASEPDARLVIGLKPGTTQTTMAEAISAQTLEDLLVYAQVQPGDVLALPANTVHALGQGLLIYEIQQSSDVTYRLYDWGRMGLDGKPRDLHIEKGVQVSRLDGLPKITQPQGEVVVSNAYFHTLRISVDHIKRNMATYGTFHALTCIEGQVEVTANQHTVSLELGQTAMIPAGIVEYELNGKGILLISHQQL